MKEKTWLKLGLFCSGIIAVALFQNCAGSFDAEKDLWSASSLDCARSDQCMETVISPPQSSEEEPPADSGDPGVPPQQSPPAAPPEPLSSALYNVVHGGGKASCEQLIGEHYGKEIQCVRGGGCGVTCGRPGPNCPSANPQHYGACFSEAELLAANVYTAPVSQPTSVLYNFVAGSKAACESSVRDRLGITANCSIGGGCGVSCGEPNGGCPSANPTLWGACIRK